MQQLQLGQQQLQLGQQNNADTMQQLQQGQLQLLANIANLQVLRIL
jgi:hypothetical protein